VTEFTATAGQTSFSVASYTVGFIDVYRNGVRLNSADYTATTGTTVVLTSGATSGDTVTTISFLVSSVLNAIPATAGSVASSYMAPLTTLPVSGGNTLTVPAVTGTMMVSGNMPAFSAYQSSAQSISIGTWTKVQLQTEQFDTNNNFDSTTNYRFTPTIAGYYQVTGGIQISSTLTNILVNIYRNGATGTMICYANGTLGGGFGSTLMYFNGTTDYVELYCYLGSGQNLSTGSGSTYFQASMVRTA